MNVLGISGSLRKGSFNTALLSIAREAAPVGMVITDADISAFPVYNEDIYSESFPTAVATFREQIAAADALLITTPEYNHGMSGVIKNAIDWASRPPEQPFSGKPIALMGASAGKLGTVMAQQQVRQALVGLNARFVSQPQIYIGAVAQVFDQNGNLSDDAATGLIGRLLAALQALTRQMS